jgi:O-glycosyl hydrolase
MAYDHNRDDVYNWAQVIYGSQLGLKYVDGMAFHWYVGQYQVNLNSTHWLQPSKFMMGTEVKNCD